MFECSDGILSFPPYKLNCLNPPQVKEAMRGWLSCIVSHVIYNKALGILRLKTTMHCFSRCYLARQFCCWSHWFSHHTGIQMRLDWGWNVQDGLWAGQPWMTPLLSLCSLVIVTGCKELLPHENFKGPFQTYYVPELCWRNGPHLGLVNFILSNLKQKMRTQITGILSIVVISQIVLSCRILHVY